MVMMRRLLLLLALAPMFALPRPRSPIRTPTLHKTIAPPLLEVACLRGGGGGVSAVEIIDALKSAAAAWFAASVVYLTTLQWSDTRQSASQRPLPDLGFQFVPAVAGAGAAADVLGSAMALYLVGTGIFGGAAGLECFRRSLVYCAGGMLFSASLHTATMLPDSDPAPPAPDALERAHRRFGGSRVGRLAAGLGRFAKFVQRFMGGATDKLMSNHVYNTGLAAHFMAVRGVIPRFCVPLWVAGGVLWPMFERCGAGKQGDIGSVGRGLLRHYPRVAVPLHGGRRPVLVGPRGRLRLRRGLPRRVSCYAASPTSAARRSARAERPSAVRGRVSRGDTQPRAPPHPRGRLGRRGGPRAHRKSPPPAPRGGTAARMPRPA